MSAGLTGLNQNEGQTRPQVSHLRDNLHPISLEGKQSLSGLWKHLSKYQGRLTVVEQTRDVSWSWGDAGLAAVSCRSAGGGLGDLLRRALLPRGLVSRSQHPLPAV